MPKDQVSKPAAVSQPPRGAPTAEHKPPHPDAEPARLPCSVRDFSTRELRDRAALHFPHKQLIGFSKTFRHRSYQKHRATDYKLHRQPKEQPFACINSTLPSGAPWTTGTTAHH